MHLEGCSTLLEARSSLLEARSSLLGARSSYLEARSSYLEARSSHLAGCSPHLTGCSPHLEAGSTLRAARPYHGPAMSRPPLALLLLLAACGAPRPAPPPAAGAGPLTLRVEVYTLDGRGAVVVGLHDAASFDGAPLRTATATAAEGRAVVAFDGVAPGAYALRAFQDADGDGALTRDAAGAPAEPFGFSGDPGGTYAGPPTFAAARFVVRADTTAYLRLRDAP
jgi:uncharacterized protein (DUF2141 family)